jgi:hypothetical protein
MAAPSQKADQRPISFVLHDTASGAPPVEVSLVIRPEDLTRTDQSRLTTTQTLGGAWADSFGKGIPALQIAGHTGWGSGDRPSGLDAFQRLHNSVFKGWHKSRDKAVAQGLDPDKVKLIFSDGLDDFTWVVAPQTFILKRNKSRPLLVQYQISMTWLADSAAAGGAHSLGGMLADMTGMGKDAGLSSLMSSINHIEDFAKNGISSVLGPVQGVFDSMLGISASALRLTHSVVSGITSITGSAASGLFKMASTLTKAAANATAMVLGIVTMPQRIKAQFMRVASAFDNAFCLLGNIFKPRKFLPNYDDLYGSSNCSSTTGGSPLSRFDRENPFPIYVPQPPSVATVSPAAAAAMISLNAADPVLSPMMLPTLALNMAAIGGGISLHA